MGNTSIKELEQMGEVIPEFSSQDSSDVERTLQVVGNEDDENTVSNKEIPACDNSKAKARPKKEKKRDNLKTESKADQELSETYLEEHIPRKKKAMKAKIKHLLIELHGKDEILSKGKEILDRLTVEREFHLERIEEKEQVIEGKEFVIQSFQEKMQTFIQRIDEKESKLREKERLLNEANDRVELLQKQQAEQEEIVKEMQSTMENLDKQTKNGHHSREAFNADLDVKVEFESLKRENERYKLQLQENLSTLREREREINSLKREKETIQQEKKHCDKISLERKFSVDRLNREKERGLAYLDQLEIRLKEKDQAMQQARDESIELRDQLKRKDNLLLEKDRTLETLENSRKGTSDRLDRLEKQWQDERRTQRNAYDALRDEKRACEERLQRAQADVETYQRRNRVLEREIDRARQTTDIFRGDQPWIIPREEIKLSDKVLGTGAWGRVLEGNFRGTKVAVKEIHEIIQSAHNRLLFDREITFATLVRHPCILQFLAVADYRTSKPLLVAELMDMSLSQLVKDEKTLGNRYIRILALDVAYGLNYLHCFRPNPILHRDVNSGNVMVWRQGDKWRGKLCDFGSAEFMGSKMSENPGNPFYCAPEANSSRHCPKMDVYSFGVLLCELCINQTPNPAERERQIALMWNKDLRELAEQCITPDPLTRCTMTDVINVLEPMTA